jgi:Rrf2 family iron-sulfur cluster assembly transcriptional regulator
LDLRARGNPNRSGEFHRPVELCASVTVDEPMSLLPRKGLLAIAAVIDVALHARGQPVAAKALATRHRLPPRHLEPVLQALVRHHLLKGIRGPRGGYELAREPCRITAHDILRAVGTIEQNGDGSTAKSTLLAHVVMPALAQAEVVFSGALGHINIEDLAGAARLLK